MICQTHLICLSILVFTGMGCLFYYQHQYGAVRKATATMSKHVIQRSRAHLLRDRLHQLEILREHTRVRRTTMLINGERREILADNRQHELLAEMEAESRLLDRNHQTQAGLAAGHLERQYLHSQQAEAMTYNIRSGQENLNQQQNNANAYYDAQAVFNAKENRLTGARLEKAFQEAINGEQINATARMADVMENCHRHNVGQTLAEFQKNAVNNGGLND